MLTIDRSTYPNLVYLFNILPYLSGICESNITANTPSFAICCFQYSTSSKPLNTLRGYSSLMINYSPIDSVKFPN